MYPPDEIILASTFEWVDDSGNLSRMTNNQLNLNFTEVQFGNQIQPRLSMET